MADIFVRGFTGLNTNTGADWNNAKASVAGALLIAVSNDRILVDQSETFNAGAAITWTPPAGNISIISAVRSGTTGFSPAWGAQEAVGPFAAAITIAGAAGSSMYVYGMSLFAGSTNSATNVINLLNTNAVSSSLYLDGCTLQVPTISAAAFVQCGLSAQSGTRSLFITVRNCTFAYGSRAGSAISVGDGVVEFIDLTLSFGATKPAQIFTASSLADSPVVLVRDSDLSSITVSSLLLTTNFSNGTFLFKNNKLVGGLFYTGTFPFGSGSLTIRNCTSPTYATSFLEYYSFFGLYTADPGAYVANTDAAVYAGTPVCWNINTGGLTSEFSPFVTQMLEVWNDVTGTRTATVEICSSFFGPFTDRQVWMEGTYDPSLAGAITNRNSQPFVGTGANHPTSTTPWSFTPNSQQQLQLTFTATVVGVLQVRIYIGMPSVSNFYINPVVKLS